MSFYPSLLGYTGAHCPVAAGNAQGCPDWKHGLVYLSGEPPSNPNAVTSCQLLTADETNTVLQSSFPSPGPDFIAPTFCVDLNGDLYWAVAAMNGGVAQVQGSTLTQLGVTLGYGGQTGDGVPTSLYDGASVYTLVAGAGNVGLAEFSAAFAPVGHITTDLIWPTPSGGNSAGYPCAGMPGTGVGYLLFGSGSVPGSPPELFLYEVNCSTGSAVNSLVTTYSPSEFNADWTTFNVGGLCIDQTDGNLLLSIQGSGSLTTVTGVLAKVNPSTGAIIWASNLPGNAPGGSMMQFSLIQYGRYAYFQPHSGSVAQQIVSVNTITGAVTTSTVGVAGIGGGPNEQSFNDSLGAIFMLGGMSGGGGPNTPTLIGETPNNYSGFQLLFAIPAEGGPAKRRYLSMPGPLV